MIKINEIAKILVVDDNKANLFLLNEMLKTYYDVVCAFNGSDALILLSQNNFDLVLLDIMMPGMDGYTVCSHIKENNENTDIPVVFLTAKADNESILKGFRVGAIDYIVKPFNNAELRARVKTQIELRNAKLKLKQELEEKTKIQQALQSSEKRYKFITESTKDIIWISDLDLNYSYINPAITQQLGYGTEEYVNMSIADRYAPQHYELIINELTDLKIQFSKKNINIDTFTKNIESQYRHKLGHYIWFEEKISIIKDENNKMIGLHGVARDINDRKTAENELRKSKELLRLIIDTLPLELWLSDLQNVCIIQNKLHQNNKGKQIGKTPSISGLDENIINVWIKNNSKALAGEKIDEEQIYYNNTSSPAFIRNIIVPFYDENQLQGTLGINIDMTELKNAQKGILKALNNSQLLVEISNSFLNIIDFDVTIKNTLNLIGNYGEYDDIFIYETKDNTINSLTYFWQNTSNNAKNYNRKKQIKDITIKNKLLETGQILSDEENYNCQNYYKIQLFLKTQQTLIFPILVINKYFGFIGFGKSNKALHIEKSEIEWLKTVTNLISNAYERSEVYKDLKESENKFRNIFNQSSDLIVITDLSGKIIDFNLQVELISGYSTTEIIGKNIRNFIDKSDFELIKIILKELNQTKSSLSKEFKLTHKSGYHIPVEINCQLINLEGKNYVSSTIRDIRERKEIEKKIVSAIIQTEEKERSRFAQDLHDGLGSLLSSINIYINMIRSGELNQAETENLLIYTKGLVDEAISSAKEIANNLRPSVLNRFGLVTTLKSVLDKIQEAGILSVKFNHNNYTDYNQRDLDTILFRIISELITNTLKHAKATTIELELNNTPEIVIVKFLDNGIGFDVEIINQTDRKGSGIKNIINRVKSIKGDIHIESQINIGTTYYIQIPLN